MTPVNSPRKKCPACGGWFRWMTAHLLSVHGERVVLWLGYPAPQGEVEG